MLLPRTHNIRYHDYNCYGRESACPSCARPRTSPTSRKKSSRPFARSWTRRSSRSRQQLEHADEYPTEIVEGLKELGIFGLTIPEEFGGLGESLLTYALCVEEIARGWMSVSGVINTHFIVAYLLMQHGTDEQKQKYLPRMATGEMRGAFSMSEPSLGSDVSAISTQGYESHRRTVSLTQSQVRRCG